MSTKDAPVTVTKALLENYLSIIDELKETEYKLQHMNDGDNMVGSSVIFDYTTGQGIPQPVVGHDYEREAYLRELYTHRIQRARREIEAVDRYIESLPDSITRRVMSMYYQRKLTQEAIAIEVRKSQGKVSRIITEELEKLEELKK